MMLNLDDTIKAFQCCIQKPPDCGNCPEQGPGFGIECRNDVKAHVLLWLKAKEPMNAIVVLNGIDRSGGWWYQCPNCKMEIEPRDKYCKNCGQGVKWD